MNKRRHSQKEKNFFAGVISLFWLFYKDPSDENLRNLQQVILNYKKIKDSETPIL